MHWVSIVYEQSSHTEGRRPNPLSLINCILGRQSIVQLGAHHTLGQCSMLMLWRWHKIQLHLNQWCALNGPSSEPAVVLTLTGRGCNEMWASVSWASNSGFALWWKRCHMNMMDGAFSWAPEGYITITQFVNILWNKTCVLRLISY